jgi:FkbM family methyltransferase
MWKHKFLLGRIVFNFRDWYVVALGKFGLAGAKIVGTSSIGNTLLSLNRSSFLGSRGSILELPRDEVIFASIKKYGEWEIEVSKFLAAGLGLKNQGFKPKTACLDIGANSGLISLQTINLSGTDTCFFLIEPIPRHVSAISHNLRNFANVSLHEFAMSDKNASTVIFTEEKNHGKSSMFQSPISPMGMIETNIRTIDTLEFCDTHLDGFDRYVIKSDTEGMDAFILSRIPLRIWQSVQCAVIEVFSVPEVIESDVEKLLLVIQKFDYVSWSPNSNIKLDSVEIRKFWLSKSRASKNLFLSRSNSA